MNNVTELKKASSAASALSSQADALREAWELASEELKQAQERHSKALSTYMGARSECFLADLRVAQLEALAKADACQAQREQHLSEAERFAEAYASFAGREAAL